MLLKNYNVQKREGTEREAMLRHLFNKVHLPIKCNDMQFDYLRNFREYISFIAIYSAREGRQTRTVIQLIEICQFCVMR